MRKTRNVGNVAGGLATVVVVLILGLLLTLTVDRSMGGDVLESNKNNSEPEQEYETQQHNSNSPISPGNNLGPEIAQILANKTNAEKIAHDIDMELIRLGYNKQLRLMIELYRKYNLIIDRICDSKESNTSQSETFQAELRSHYARVQKFFNDNEEFKLNLERDNIDLNSVESGLAEKSETATRDIKKLLAKIKSLLTSPFRKIFKKDKLKPETPVPPEPQLKQFEWQKDMTDKEMNKISAFFSAAYNNKWKLGFLGFLAGVGYLAWRGPLNHTEETVKATTQLLTTQDPILSLFNNPTTASLLAAFLLIILAILAYIHFCDKRRSNRSTFSKQDSKKIEKKVAEKNNNNNKNSVFKSDSSKKKTLKKEARKKNKPSKREQSTIVVEPSSSSSSSLSRRSSMLPSPPDSKKAKSYRGSKLSTISMSSKSTPIFSKFTSNLRSAKQ